MKKFKGWLIMLLISLSLFGLTACGGDNNNSYEQITPEQAKTIMDTETDYIIIDARTQDEFAEGHIENAILIPEYEIADVPKRNSPIKSNLSLFTAVAVEEAKLHLRNL